MNINIHYQQVILILQQDGPVSGEEIVLYL